MIPPVNVIVPTFERPAGLRRAVQSLFAQTYADRGFRLIIVDNTPQATAKISAARLQRDCPDTIDMVFLHEPQPGVANARNKAMSAVEGSLVAFLDDDQCASEDWLERLLASYRRFPAAVTFGPVHTALPATQLRHTAYFQAFFARTPFHKPGYVEQSYGCGNALVDFSAILGGAPWFDARMNEVGGEDDLLFARVRQSGGRFAWASDAHVYEHPPADRITLHYTLKRAFSYGQAPITMALKQVPKRYDLMLKWMLVGAGKFVWHGAQWAGLSLIQHPRRAFQLDQAVRGLSKLLWWIDLKFYGVSALRDAQATSQATPAATKNPAPRQV